MNAFKGILIHVVLLTFFLLEQKYSLQFEERWITRSPDYRRFAASVYIRMTWATDGFCTGTLLEKRWVLTAARCMFQGGDKIVENDTSITVYARVDDRLKLDNDSIQKRKSIMVRFYKESYHSIVLIKLSEAFYTMLGVESATVTLSGFIDVEDDICNSGSYGVQPNNDTRMKNMEFELNTCACHGELKKYYPNELVDKWICGSSKMFADICQGDIGMGMMCDGVLQAVCIGIVFFENTNSCNIIEDKEHQCGQNQSMGLYVDVCYYIDWLRTYIPTVDKAKHGCDSRSSATLGKPVRKWFNCCASLVLIFLFGNTFY